MVHVIININDGRDIVMIMIIARVMVSATGTLLSHSKIRKLLIVPLNIKTSLNPKAVRSFLHLIVSAFNLYCNLYSFIHLFFRCLTIFLNLSIQRLWKERRDMMKRKQNQCFKNRREEFVDAKSRHSCK